MPIQPEIPEVAVKAASDALLAAEARTNGAVARNPEVFRGGVDRQARTALEAALPRLLPGLFFADDAIWLEGTPAHPGRPEVVMERTRANAYQFDMLARLLPDRADEED